MSKKPVKCISRYVDGYGNTGIGNIIALCIIKKDGVMDDYQIVEPQSLKERWSSTYYDFYPLPEDLATKFPVGYYTTGSHYKISKMAGYANLIKKKKYYDTLVDKPDSDSRTTTWYSKGLKIKEGISKDQTHLYHL